MSIGGKVRPGGVEWLRGIHPEQRRQQCGIEVDESGSLGVLELWGGQDAQLGPGFLSVGPQPGIGEWF